MRTRDERQTQDHLPSTPSPQQAGYREANSSDQERLLSSLSPPRSLRSEENDSSGRKRRRLNDDNDEELQDAGVELGSQPQSPAQPQPQSQSRQRSNDATEPLLEQDTDPAINIVGGSKRKRGERIRQTPQRLHRA